MQGRRSSQVEGTGRWLSSLYEDAKLPGIWVIFPTSNRGSIKVSEVKIEADREGLVACSTVSSSHRVDQSQSKNHRSLGFLARGRSYRAAMQRFVLLRQASMAYVDEDVGYKRCPISPGHVKVTLVVFRLVALNRRAVTYNWTDSFPDRCIAAL